MPDATGATTLPSAGDRDQLLSALRDNLGEPTLALSAEQSRLWFLQQLFPAAPFHHCRAVEVGARCEAGRLERAFADLARTHETLRSAFVQLGPKPIRLVNDDVALRVRVVPVGDASDEEYRRAITEVLAEDTRPFDFRSPPLVRLTAVEHRGRCALLLTAHQLVADQYSLDRLLDRLLDRCYGRDAARPIADTALEFGAFVRDEITWIRSDRCADDLQRTREALEGVQALNFPSDLAAPELRSSRGSRLEHRLTGETSAALVKLADAERTTVAAIVLAAFQLLLAWHCHQDDLTVGVTRDEDEGRGQIGPFFDVAIVRSRVSRHHDFVRLARAAADACRSAFARPRTPYAEVVNRLQPSRDLNKTPLFQAHLWSAEEPSSSGRWTVPIEPLPIDPGTAPFDLSLGVVMSGGAVRLVLDYSLDVFHASSVVPWLRRLVWIVDTVTLRPDVPLFELTVLSPEERDAIVEQWKASEHDFPAELGAHELVEQQAARTPDRIGAVAAGSRQFSYAEIERRANRIAVLLRARGLEREAVVALSLDHSPEVLMAVLGIWKAGGAYIPLDAQWPAARTAFVIDDVRARMLLLSRHGSAALTAVGVERVFIEDAEEASRITDPLPTHPRQIAYVIYTSGSTGLPKGVAVEHRSLVNNLTWRQRTWRLNDGDRVLQSLAPTFDPSLWTMFWGLIAGATVIYPTATAVVDLAAQAAVMTSERVTVFAGAPSLHAVLAEEERFDTCRVRYVFAGGETLSLRIQRALRQRFRADVINVYGPTEATIDCAAWTCAAEETGVIPIGRPVANTRIHIVNTYGQLNAPQVHGEICIGGTALARGYVGNPALTAERFVPDPFSGVPGSRLYRTGDVGEMRNDRLYFVGRVDDQVKIRGFRIELGEIERTLGAHPRVRHAAVVVDRMAPAQARLLAFIVLTPGEPVSHEELTGFLQTRLPKYMIPESIATVATFPLTTSGKVDKGALLASAAGPTDQRPFRPPRDTLEAEIASIVAPVLNREAVGIDQDIFDLGCNSLLIARIASRLSSIYKVDLPVRQLFRDPTVAGIAELVALSNRGQAPAPSSGTLEQMIADAALDPLITADGLPPFEHRDAKLVFITGATGYIGCFLIERLLRTTSVECACLVRASGPEEGLARIRDAMRGYDAWDDAFASRIRPVVGDLGKDRLGIDPGLFMTLAAEVDAIYHCGALVNFVYPYAALRAPNVFGTHEVLRLACTTRVKPVHYTSTIDVLLMTHAKRPFLEDDLSVLEHPNEVPDGYGRSKWVAERMLTTARSRGVPIVVYRLGLTLGHTRTGATQTNDFLLVGLKGCLDLGVSYIPEMMMDSVPVDFVAAAFAHISLRPDSYGKYFHIWNPAPVHIDEIYGWVRTFGYAIDRVPLAVFRESALKHVDASSPLYPFIPGLRLMLEEPMTLHHPSIMSTINVFDECRNTYAALNGSGIECPPLTPDIAHSCLSYLVKIGFLPAPSARSG